jgi:precorrin-3B C17-methyltransferase
MSGRLHVIGLGPGDPDLMTPEAARAVAEAEVFLGYAGYLDRIVLMPGQRREASDNREEAARARAALEQAAAGAKVAMITGGDPGVFAMAAAVCEQVEEGPAAWKTVDLVVLPGITAMLALAARVGAPLGHDFCVISLSDNLKPWEVVERRLDAAASGGFAIALYNPRSQARPWQLGSTFDRLRRHLPPSTAVVFGRAVRRPDEAIAVTTLAEADPAMADMSTCVIIGSPATRIVPRPGLPPLVYSPRMDAR